MIRLICPGCEKTLQVNDNLAGRAIDCPSCKTRFRVPAPEPAPEDLPAEKPAPAARRGATAPKDDDRDPPPRKRRDDDDDDRPRKRRDDDEDKDDRPRSRRRDDDDEDKDDRPRSRRRDDDDDEDDRPRRRRRDDDDEDDRPRMRTKKRRKVVRSGGDGSGFASWSPTTKILSISAVVAGVCVAIGFIWPPIVLAAMAIGYILMFVGGIMFLVVAFRDDVVQGLLCLFVPFYSLFYLITHFDECKQSFFMQIAGFAILICSMCSGIGGLAVMGDDDAPRRGRKAEIRLVAPAVPQVVLG